MKTFLQALLNTNYEYRIDIYSPQRKELPWTPSPFTQNPPACNAPPFFRALTKAGIPFNEIDLTTDGDARDYVMSLGYLQAPVVYAGPTNHFAGFRPDRINQLKSQAA